MLADRCWVVGNTATSLLSLLPAVLPSGLCLSDGGGVHPICLQSCAVVSLLRCRLTDWANLRGIHTAGNTQFGGVHFGFVMALYQLASYVGTCIFATAW